MTAIERELHLLSGLVPDFRERLMRVRQSIQEGKIDGAIHGERGICRCFYGHFTGGGREESIALAQEMRTRTEPYYTPIELLVEPVLPGETPETNKRLAELMEALNPYIEQEQREEVLV